MPPLFLAYELAKANSPGRSHSRWAGISILYNLYKIYRQKSLLFGENYFPKTLDKPHPLCYNRYCQEGSVVVNGEVRN